MTKFRKAINVRLIVAISLVVAVAAVVIVGVILLDSPAQERLRRLDVRRVGDLRSISAELDFYRTRARTLRSSLEELSDKTGVFLELYDPESGEATSIGSSAATPKSCARSSRATLQKSKTTPTETTGLTVRAGSASRWKRRTSSARWSDRLLVFAEKCCIRVACCVLLIFSPMSARLHRLAQTISNP